MRIILRKKYDSKGKLMQDLTLSTYDFLKNSWHNKQFKFPHVYFKEKFEICVNPVSLINVGHRL